MSDFAFSIALAFHRAAQIKRADLYGTTPDPQMPLHLQEDAKTPSLGFRGRGYKPGGIVIFGINPGGGGDAYENPTSLDRDRFPLTRQFVSSSETHVLATFEAMCSNYAEQVQQWNLWRILKPTIDACGCTLDEICYLNCFPYRTRQDKMPSTKALSKSWGSVVAPILLELQPSFLVALGKKAGNIVARFHSEPPRLFVVPRTIGDGRVSSEAQDVLATIRKHVTKH